MIARPLLKKSDRADMEACVEEVGHIADRVAFQLPRLVDRIRQIDGPKPPDRGQIVTFPRPQITEAVAS